MTVNAACYLMRFIIFKFNTAEMTVWFSNKHFAKLFLSLMQNKLVQKTANTFLYEKNIPVSIA